MPRDQLVQSSPITYEEAIVSFPSKLKAANAHLCTIMRNSGSHHLWDKTQQGDMTLQKQLLHFRIIGSS